jgi:hypothetical protein
VTAEPAVDPIEPVLLDQKADSRGSPIPTAALVATRFMELRRRRGLIAALTVVTIGIPTVFLAARLLLHAIAPNTYGPAGGYDIYTGLSAGVLYVFGFIVAAALGCTAGSDDLTDGVFRHLVITGRSRVALYLARIPAGLAIIVPLVAIGFSIVCAVCVFAAPNTTSYGGLTVPAGMTKPQLESWAAGHAKQVICDVPYTGRVAVPVAAACGGPPPPSGAAGGNPHVKTLTATPAQLRAAAVRIADLNYADYRTRFASPPVSLMVKTGLWIELEAIIGFVVGLGLGSLIGQRTVGVILMIILEIVLTPIFLRAQIPHLINLQRAAVGVATAHLEPGQLPLAFGGGGGDYRVTESTTTAVIVVLAWLVAWTALGAWRMATRDA